MNLKKLLWVNEDKLNEQERIKLKIAFKKYKKFPVLYQSWFIKEKIIYMYRANSQEEAKKRFDDIIMFLETNDHSRYLTTLRKTLKKWRIPILNYFKNIYTSTPRARGD